MSTSLRRAIRAQGMYYGIPVAHRNMADVSENVYDHIQDQAQKQSLAKRLGMTMAYALIGTVAARHLVPRYVRPAPYFPASHTMLAPTNSKQLEKVIRELSKPHVETLLQNENVLRCQLVSKAVKTSRAALSKSSALLNAVEHMNSNTKFLR